MKKIKVYAKDKSEALNKAVESFSKELQRKVSKEELEFVKMEEKRSFLGLRKKKEYSFKLLKEKEEDQINSEEVEEIINLDGYFELQIKSDGIFLKVVAPEGKGDPASLQKIKHVIESKELVDVDMDLVREVHKEATGEFIKIAERKPELDRDAYIEADISTDQMSGYCTYIPPLGGQRLTLKEAIQSLKEQGIEYGIKKDKLKKFIKDNIKQSGQIAEGKPAEDGKPAKLHFNFNLSKEKKHVKELEDGKLDFYNLDLVVNVNKGDLLVTKKPPIPGVPGIKVTGEKIPPQPGKDVKLPKGKNVEISGDGLSLLAGIDGQVKTETDKVSVLPIYTVEGDVNLETGNIDFIGNVIVNGNVQEGFSVKADGDIEVKGNVSAATLEASGDIKVHKGFKGKQKGLLRADGDIEIGFIENGQVISKGNLIVKGAIMHSSVVAKMDIIVEGKGLIVGGTIQAGNDVEARVIGSHLATTTKITAGENPELRQQIEQIEIDIDGVEENLEKVVKGMSVLTKAKKYGRLKPEKVKMLEQFEDTKGHLEKQLKQLKEQREMLSTQLKEQKSGRVKVQERVHPGVVINIGQAGMRVKDTVSHSAFVYDEGEVRPIPL